MMSEGSKIVVRCSGCETSYKIAASQIRDVTKNIRCPTPKCDDFLNLISVKAKLENETAVAMNGSNGASFVDKTKENAMKFSHKARNVSKGLIENAGQYTEIAKHKVINGIKEKKVKESYDNFVENAMGEATKYSDRALDFGKKVSANIDQLTEMAKDRARNRKIRMTSGTSFQGGQQFGKRRIKYSIIIFLVLLTFQIPSLRSILYENAILGAIDQNASETIDKSLKRAMIALGIAKALNSGISVLQGSELSVEPMGIGVSIAVGEILDPVNDMVERFSWIMMVSMMALGIQKILLQIGPWLSIKFLFSFGLLSLLFALWTKRNWQSTCILVAKKTLLFALIARFSIPLVVYLNDLTYHVFLDDQYQAASSQIKEGEDAFENTDFEALIESSSPQKNEEGYLEKATSMVNKVRNFIDFKDRIDWIKEKASAIGENLIRLSVVFFINTILLPIGFLWGLLKFSRLVLGYSFGTKLEETFRSKITNRKMSSNLATQAI